MAINDKKKKTAKYIEVSKTKRDFLYSAMEKNHDINVKKLLDSVQKLDPVLFEQAKNKVRAITSKFKTQKEREAWLDGFGQLIYEIEDTKVVEKSLIVYHLVKGQTNRMKKRRNVKYLREILNYYDEGYSINQVAQIYGVTPHTVRDWNKKLWDWGFEFTPPRKGKTLPI